MFMMVYDFYPTRCIILNLILELWPGDRKQNKLDDNHIRDFFVTYFKLFSFEKKIFGSLFEHIKVH